MTQSLNIRVGADPEIFIVDIKGCLVSAHGLIKGNKIVPYKVTKGAVQVDGIALEYNIDPAESQEEFVTNNITVQKILKRMLPRTLQFDMVPYTLITPEFFKSQPAEAMELGCDPSYSAYTLSTEKVFGDPTMRTAAGHIHLGYTKTDDILDPDHFENAAEIVRELDVFCDVFTAEYSDIESECIRRKMYGAKGSFRPKKYGLEYRTLSNFWIRNPELMAKAYDITSTVCRRVLTGKELLSLKYQSNLSDLDPNQIEEVKSLVSI